MKPSELKQFNDSDYYISHTGEVYSKFPPYRNAPTRYRKLNPWANKQGYKTITIKGKQYRVHRLVAQAFIPNPLNKPHVNHIDCNPSNNHVDNLEWCTPKENIAHSIKLKRRKIHEKLTESDVIEIRASEKGSKALGKIYGVSESAIREVKTLRSWVNVPVVGEIKRGIAGTRKLTDEQAMEVLDRSKSRKYLAEKFNISFDLIIRIRRGERYKHLPRT